MSELERIEKEADEYCTKEYQAHTTSYLIARYFYIAGANATRLRYIESLKELRQIAEKFVEFYPVTATADKAQAAIEKANLLL